MVAKTSKPDRKPRKAKNYVLPANAEVRSLADEVMAAGNYGSYVNTLAVSLRDQLKRLKGDGVPSSLTT